MKLSHLFNSLPKRLAAAGLVALAIALPVATSAANLVKMEADTTIANATQNAGTMNWGKSTSAKYNEVVAVQVVYDNDETAGSGKTTNNLDVKINLPSTSASAQTVTTSVSASNMTTINGSATVNFSDGPAFLQYIPGTATWKHAVSDNGPMTTVTKLEDSKIVTANGNIDANLGTENPCQAGSIVIQARVMVPGVSINKEVRVKGTHTWARSIDAAPGATVQYMISYTNDGNTDENKVVIGDKLPDGVTYVPGTTYLANDSAPNGKLVTDGVTTTGIIIGDYAPTANAFVMFDATLPSADKLACGDNLLRNIATAQPQGMNYYWNTADVHVNKTCANTPTYTCSAFHVTTGDNRTVTVDAFTFSASDNSSLDSAVLDWGDNSNVTTNNVVGQTHQYAQDGSYTISLTSFKVGGQTVNVSGNCSQTVTFGPTTLVNTGAGNVVGLFAAVTVLGAFAHRLFLSRRLSRD